MTIETRKKKRFFVHFVFNFCTNRFADYIIVAINNRPVKEITWEEQRKGLELQGETTYTVQKPDGQIVSYTLFIGKQII